MIVLSARYIFPITAPPIEGGYVAIEGDRIVQVGVGTQAEAIDLGNSAILPSLVNAHTHLEFSGLAMPLGHAGISLPRWIPEVIAARARRISSPMDDTRQAIEQGLKECRYTGTAAVGEIASGGWTAELLSHTSLDLTLFYEVLGLRADLVEPRLAEAGQFVEQWRQRSSDARWYAGLSPHAPYSVHPELVVGLIRLAAAHQLPVAMHLAESREEIEVLQSGTGAFRDLLMALDAWDEAAIPRGARPLEYLRLLAEAPRSLVIHGNYLDAEEREFLAENREQMSVVYCPRTHAYFGHAKYPLIEMLTRGASVALGTDSRASNPDLNLLSEMRFVARQFPGVAGNTILRLGTLDGARALGREAEQGSLDAHKLANLVIVALPDRTADDSHKLLFQSDLPVVASYYRGAKVTGGNS